MLNAPQIDPVLFHLGPLAVRWYGLMYLLGFVAAFFIISRLAPRRQLPLDSDAVSDLLFYIVLGVILGGRCGYVIFYNYPYFLGHPLQIFAVWQGGMSFHGGLTGVVVATLIYCRRHAIAILPLADILAIAATIGLGLGRIGNFINGELWGRVTTLPWGVIFPAAGPQPRHPSQLYEALLEGPILFFLLYWLFARKVRNGSVFFLFLISYGVGRFIIEFFREPDQQIGFLWGGATLGQILCLTMILLGSGGLFWLKRREETC
jgi:phosphatidylglycerol---prolipoprotein diacylglyceryl transferase